jgi:NMD protein affecting ribosome stability and mRNA decay
MKRLNELYDVKLHDPYMDRSIYKDPTVCPDCKLIYHNKRWVRNEELLEKFLKDKKSIDYKKCPACRKTQDDYPLGILRLSGSYIKSKRIEILNLIRNEAEFEEKRNPLARIMKIEEEDNGLLIKTTTESLARRLGRAVNKAHHGEISYIFSDTQKFLRVEWRKD